MSVDKRVVIVISLFVILGSFVFVFAADDVKVCGDDNQNYNSEAIAISNGAEVACNHACPCVSSNNQWVVPISGVWHTADAVQVSVDSAAELLHLTDEIRVGLGDKFYSLQTVIDNIETFFDFSFDIQMLTIPNATDGNLNRISSLEDIEDYDTENGVDVGTKKSDSCEQDYTDLVSPITTANLVEGETYLFRCGKGVNKDDLSEKEVTLSGTEYTAIYTDPDEYKRISNFDTITRQTQYFNARKDKFEYRIKAGSSGLDVRVYNVWGVSAGTENIGAATGNICPINKYDQCSFFGAFCPGESYQAQWSEISCSIDLVE
jgi:hypothetical protein